MKKLISVLMCMLFAVMIYGQAGQNETFSKNAIFVKKADFNGVTHFNAATYFGGTNYFTGAVDFTSPTSMNLRDYLQVGKAGYDGYLWLYSEQGVTDYYIKLHPPTTMTESIDLYFPVAYPGGTYPITMTTGGIMGYGDQNVLTTSSPTFAAVTSTGPVIGTTGAFSGILGANGGFKSTAYQKIDSTSGTAVTAGKTIVGVWNHYHTILAIDTINLSNMVVGELITVVRLGATLANGVGGVSTCKTTIKAPAGAANLTAVFFPNAGSTTGATSVDLTTAAPVKHFYKMDATHIWVY